MTDLLDRLRKVDGSDEGTHWYRNPDGPEAAAEIERLRAALAEAEALLREVQLFLLDAYGESHDDVDAFLARRSET